MRASGLAAPAGLPAAGDTELAVFRRVVEHNGIYGGTDPLLIARIERLAVAAAQHAHQSFDKADIPPGRRKLKRVKPGGRAGADTEVASAHLAYRHLRRPVLVEIHGG